MFTALSTAGVASAAGLQWPCVQAAKAGHQSALPRGAEGHLRPHQRRGEQLQSDNGKETLVWAFLNYCEIAKYC